ncbi:MAG: endopeptidase La [Oscillospiraceae bacterium]|nr:endopeptidase La [Oscillospiraceae bacterium]
MARTTRKKLVPLIAVRGLVVFPYMNLSFDVARPRSVAAVEQALKNDRTIFLVSQKDEFADDVTENDLFTMGTVAKIKQKIELSDGAVRIHIEGISRASMLEFLGAGPFPEAIIQCHNSTDDTDPIFMEASARRLRALVGAFKLFHTHTDANTPPDSFFNTIFSYDPASMADSLASNILIRVEDKQELLETLSVTDRIGRLIELISTELKVLEAEADILDRVNEQMEQNNRDYFLREQVRAIREELGENEDSDKYYEKIAAANLPDSVREKAMEEAGRLEHMPPTSPESTVARDYIDLLLELPWLNFSEESSDIDKAAEVLDRDHYGLNKVKERILEQLAVAKLTGKTAGTVLCLVGPPGVGKTSIARSLAEATGRSFARMSLGGVRDEAEIRGHRRTYVGAMPGRLVNAIKQAKTMNPLILLDEIDKVISDGHGDPSAALLEVLDGEQNNSFRDNYLELPLDLSRVMFVTTANTLDTIPRPLLDRMEVIELSSYTTEEKLEIASRYLVPKQMEKHGLKKSMLKLRPGVLEAIISGYTGEAGVRNLEREIKTLCRKTAAEIVGGRRSLTVSEGTLSKYLGVRKYLEPDRKTEAIVGVATGLAWTSIGGDTLDIEVGVMDGTGKLELTGSLGDVMKESARAAMSFVRSVAAELKINPDFYKTKDIHIHVPEGATPKDGPSAGITMATAIASALSGRPVRCDIAMTGEVTLRGRVLAIGGLKEKSLAAYRLGIKTIIIPEANRKDFDELAPSVRENVRFIPVKDCREVLKTALLPVAQAPTRPTVEVHEVHIERRPPRHEYS